MIQLRLEADPGRVSLAMGAEGGEETTLVIRDPFEAIRLACEFYKAIGEAWPHAKS